MSTVRFLIYSNLTSWPTGGTKKSARISVYPSIFCKIGPRQEAWKTSRRSASMVKNNSRHHHFSGRDKGSASRAFECPALRLYSCPVERIRNPPLCRAQFSSSRAHVRARDVCVCVHICVCVIVAILSRDLHIVARLKP